jgi:hypothetical protein
VVVAVLSTLIVVTGPRPAQALRSGGYLLADAREFVYSFGSATNYGSLRPEALAHGISDIEVQGTGGTGCWLVGSDGGVFAFGTRRLPVRSPACGCRTSRRPTWWAT